ncbi:glutathione synthetase-like isoform X1 [Neodiprion fabricii]|uniref:glutathione synthetase-like isoform X1 n=2 Tax=Neodiprion fabricii TaxID=2872261 RepID=UPI001ED91FB7|nr:glutathione synthetase-like isoform X1 [Neodiprion fabricii]
MNDTMNLSPLETCVKLPLCFKELEEVTDKAKDWLLMHGACMRCREHLDKDEVRFAPFVLLPSAFPRKEFEKARKVQTILNELTHQVAHDHNFITETLKSTVEVDDFTARLFGIYETVHAEGFKQSISLGLLRSDYLLHNLHETNIMQVEMNTIASSFAGIATTITHYHRYILKELECEDKLKNIPENHALSGLCEGLIEAWKLYNNKRAVILFIIEDTTINICDQRFHEFLIREKNSSIKVIRKSLGQVASEAHLNQNQDLIVGNSTVAVVYFRSGYEPAQYPTEHEWSARLMIERSSAIKCPSIQYHLAGTKKVQQALAVKGTIEKYFKDRSIVEKIRTVFTGLYSLDFDENGEGEKAVTMALKEPGRFVLKPQREGGGNNVYGKDVLTQLKAMRDSKERTAWILMDRIHPPLQENYLIRPGNTDELKTQNLVSELGIYGVILGDSNEVKINKQVGHVLRTKPASSDEGGIVAGAGALDSPYLVQ